MICQLIKTTKITLVLFIYFFYNFSKAQEAEKIFKKEYSKLSFIFQPSILEKSRAGNIDGTLYPSMEFIDDFSYQFGVYYNFAQSGNFNFKTGLIAKEFIPKFNLNISDADIGNGLKNSLTEYDPFNQFMISVPIKADYFFKITDKINLVFGAGLNFSLTTGMNETITTGVSIIENGNSRQVFFAQSDHQNNYNLSTEFSFGMNYKTKFALIDVSAFVSRTISNNYLRGQYEIFNLVQSPDKVGGFEIFSNFYGLSLNISPKKGWLKSK